MADENKHAHIEFFTKEIQNKRKSLEEGRPIFEEQEFVRIRFVGDKHRVHVAPAHDKFERDPNTGNMLTYAEAYNRHYEEFRKGNAEYHGEGTPLSELPFLTQAKRAELKAMNIHTAEALSAVEGTPLKNLGMGARGLKDQATAWLDRAKGGALEAKLSAENAALKEQMNLMQAQIAEMAAAGKTAKPVEPGNPDSQFNDWDDADIKAFLKDRTGAAPRGTPTHETLVTMAEEVIAREKAEEAA